MVEQTGDIVMVIADRGGPIDIGRPEFLHEVIGELAHVFVFKRGEISIKFGFQVLFWNWGRGDETGEVDVVTQDLLALDDLQLKLLVIEENLRFQIHDVSGHKGR